MRAPEFWQRRSLVSTMLAPVGWAFAAGGCWCRARVRSVRVGVPVVCVGNAVAGGAGKTPTVLALAALLADLEPHALTRGYRGRLTGPVRVEPGWHRADDVGDEPLLLARALPTWVARDRLAGAKAAAGAGAGLILMDDGFQNPHLAKDVSLLVVDGRQGFGNGRCIPAGPLREPSARTLARADAVVLVGEEPIGAALEAELASVEYPIFRAWVAPAAGAAARFAGRRWVAFAGIALPEKFFRSLTTAGAELVGMHAFADHHAFTAAELAGLAEQAAAAGASLATTEKDWVRLPPEWQPRVAALPVAMALEAPAEVAGFVRAAALRRAGVAGYSG